MQLQLGHMVTSISPRFTLLRACGSLRFLGFFFSLLSIFLRDSGCIVGGLLLWGFECRLSHCEDAVNDTGWLTSHQVPRKSATLMGAGELSARDVKWVNGALMMD